VLRYALNEKESQMKHKKRNLAREIISDLKQMHATLKAGIPLRKKYTARTVRAIPIPGACTTWSEPTHPTGAK
jgi:hypothetical protein